MPHRQPWFYNAVALVSTRLSSQSLLRALVRIEWKIGRRRHVTGASRIIDLDLLMRGNDVIANDSTVVPHPRMHERAFVLVPCAELAGEFVHPALGVDVRELRDGLAGTDVVAKLPASIQRSFRSLVGDRAAS